MRGLQMAVRGANMGNLTARAAARCGKMSAKTYKFSYTIILPQALN